MPPKRNPRGVATFGPDANALPCYFVATVSDFLRILSKKTQAKDSLVFRGVLGGRLKADTVRNSLVRDVLDPISKDAQAISSAGFRSGRLHSFRHYFCSACANQGVPEQVVKEWLGHADSKMVRHYYHLHDEEAQRQMGRVSFVRSIHGNVATNEGLDDLANSRRNRIGGDEK